MNISMTRALRELWLPENRLATLFIPILLGTAIWQAKRSHTPALEGAMDVATSVFLIGYGLQAIRDIHTRGQQARLPHPSALFTTLPLAFSFCLANLPHFGLMLLFFFAALLIGSKALMGAGLWLVGCYFFAWMFAYDALAINFTRHHSLSDALNMPKAFALIGQARSPYCQAALLPMICTFPVYMVLNAVDHAYQLGGWPLLPGVILSQLSVLWNLTALKQWMALLQPAPTENRDPGLSPS